MPSHARHDRQAIHNEELLHLLKDQNLTKEFSDWFVTVAFYSGVHLFESFLAKYNKTLLVDRVKIECDHSDKLCRFYNTNSGHHVRKRLMLDNKNIFKDIYNPYQNLYEMSRVARYDCNAPYEHSYGYSEFYLNEVKTGFKKLLKSKRKK